MEIDQLYEELPSDIKTFLIRPEIDFEIHRRKMQLVFEVIQRFAQRFSGIHIVGTNLSPEMIKEKDELVTWAHKNYGQDEVVYLCMLNRYWCRTYWRISTYE